MSRDSNEPAASSSLSDDADEESRPTRLDADAAFDLLSSRRRRLAVASLQESDGAVSLASLAERVAASEEETTPGDASPETRRACRISLHHVHLPKLAAAGLVEYDASDHWVRPTDDFEVLAERL